jgi:hypothetical protein
MVASPAMTPGGRPRDEPPDVLSLKELAQLRDRIAHLGPDGVRRIYEDAFEKCRLIYGRVPSPRKMQTLVQVLEAVVEVAAVVGSMSVMGIFHQPPKRTKACTVFRVDCCAFSSA